MSLKVELNQVKVEEINFKNAYTELEQALEESRKSNALINESKIQCTRAHSDFEFIPNLHR